MEIVPQAIISHPQILRYIKRLGKKREFTILDKSYHYQAMVNLVEKERRGRPDIIHLTLLEALGAPLNLEGLLRVYVHTYNNHIITFKPEIRLPRNFNRFIGLMEQLFEKRKVPPEGDALMTLQDGSLEKLLGGVKPKHSVVLTRNGQPEPPFKLAERLAKYEELVVVVGGFPQGHISEQSLRLINEQISIDPSGLDAGIATSRLLSAYEAAIGLMERRLQRIHVGGTPENSKTRKT